MRRAACAAVLSMACSFEIQAGDRRTCVPGNFDYKAPTISAEQARELARFKGNLRLWGLETLSPKAAQRSWPENVVTSPSRNSRHLAPRRGRMQDVILGSLSGGRGGGVGEC